MQDLKTRNQTRDFMMMGHNYTDKFVQGWSIRTEINNQKIGRSASHVLLTHHQLKIDNWSIYIYTVEIQYSGVLFIMCSLIPIHIYYITLLQLQAAKQIIKSQSNSQESLSFSAINT